MHIFYICNSHCMNLCVCVFLCIYVTIFHWLIDWFIENILVKYGWIVQIAVSIHHYWEHQQLNDKSLCLKWITPFVQILFIFLLFCSSAHASNTNWTLSIFFWDFSSALSPQEHLISRVSIAAGWELFENAFCAHIYKSIC